MPRLTVDNRAVEVPEGTTVLEAARCVGIEIPTLCHLPGRPAHPSCYLCMVRVDGAARLVPACGTVAADGMRVESEVEEVRDARRTAVELLLSDHLGDCVGPCQGVCPAHLETPRMMRQIAAGQFREALITVKESIALPAVLGRICPELCEKGCRRAVQDGSVSVCALKRFVADADLASENPFLPTCAPASGKRVAILGAGPAGLAAAYYLLQQGHACTLFDDHDRPGGMLRYGVSEDTLPRAVLDAEIGVIERMGMEFRGGIRVGVNISLEALRQEFDAVLIAVGEVKRSGPPDPELTLTPQGIQTNRRSMQANLPAVFVAGSAILPSRHAVRAAADGKAAAESIHRYLAGATAERDEKEFSVHIGRLEADEVQPFLRIASPERRIEPTGGNESGFSPEEARREAARCLHCDCRKADGCKLRRYAVEYEANPAHFKGERRAFAMDDTHPLVVFEPGKCIACGVCVRIAAEQGEHLGMSFAGRGFAVRMAVPFGETLAEGLKTAARACAESCPTGALTLKDELQA